MAPVPPLGTSLNVDVVINRGVGKMTLGHAPSLSALRGPLWPQNILSTLDKTFTRNKN